ncbi:MAG TPA: hypothetical protein VGG03_03780 [Thermoanaerobaculia bacterium]|jgi:hypothetical protein
MPKEALADTLDEGETLLAALDGEEALNLPHLRELRDQLASMVAAIKELAAEQADLQARRQAVTQQLRITRRQGRDLVIKVRAAIRGQLGHRNELLVRYRMRPIRRRSRAKDEAVGVAVFPRPDLLAAAGLEHKLPEAIPAPGPTTSSEAAAAPEPGPVSLATAVEAPEPGANSSREI